MLYPARTSAFTTPKAAPRAHWRKQLPHWWSDYQWLVVATLGLLAVGLGYFGFAKHGAALGERRSFWDLLYLSLQLFPLQSGAVPLPISWELQVARLLAPAVTVYTAAKALATIFYGRIRSLKLWFIQGHVVICGLGQKGYLLVRGFRAFGQRVVVLERNVGNPYIEACQELGALVLVGDATTPELLLKARVDRARHVACVCDEDGVNAEVALQVQDVAMRHGCRGLTCYVHVVDPQLCTLLREREFGPDGGESFTLEFFNVYDCGARAMLQEYPPFGGDTSATSPPHLLVVGLGRMGHSLVIHAAKAWRDRRGSIDERLRIAIIDREARRKIASLCLRYPRLEKACELIPLNMEIRSPEFERADFLFADPQHNSAAVSMAYVCLDDDSSGLFTGLALLQHLRKHSVPIVVRMKQYGGLATFLSRPEGGKGIFKGLHAFGLLDRTCTPESLLGGTYEILARAIHEEYVRLQSAQGQSSATVPFMMPWDTLPEEIREANRQQARHIRVKLEAVGCAIAPLIDWDAPLLKFTSQEVEQLAKMEHRRYLDAHEGWRRGPGSLEKKQNPYLVPWEDLSEDIRELDRNPVCQLPTLLARAGFQVYRLGDAMASEGLSFELRPSTFARRH